MASIPELKVEGLHPDHADILQGALAEARELLERAGRGPLGSPDPLEDGEDRRPPTAAAGTVASEGQGAESPWKTDQVVSWVSPHHQKKGQR
ncbi:hypothetical protein [Mycobacteroides abscessus]|uniref:hypothetical protein n=1 Tax=Mycobacteroides abscessus TaxID=36809 RepID=UPI0003A2C7F8|nr:hypothetical protein [Mycobacteroides abscessus]